MKASHRMSQNIPADGLTELEVAWLNEGVAFRTFKLVIEWKQWGRACVCMRVCGGALLLLVNMI